MGSKLRYEPFFHVSFVLPKTALWSCGDCYIKSQRFYMRRSIIFWGFWWLLLLEKCFVGVNSLQCNGIVYQNMCKFNVTFQNEVVASSYLNFAATQIILMTPHGSFDRAVLDNQIIPRELYLDMSSQTIVHDILTANLELLIQKFRFYIYFLSQVLIVVIYHVIKGLSWMEKEIVNAWSTSY